MRGDWKWQKAFFCLKPSWQSVNVCHMCDAQSPPQADKAGSEMHSQATMTAGMLGFEGGAYPSLNLKAWNSRLFVVFFEVVLRDLVARDAGAGNELLCKELKLASAATTAMCAFLDGMESSPRYLSDDQCRYLHEAMQSFLELYEVLIATSNERHTARWKAVPKHHLAWHMVEEMDKSRYNVRFYHSFQDEDFLGQWKTLVQSVSSGTASSSSASHFFVHSESALGLNPNGAGLEICDVSASESWQQDYFCVLSFLVSGEADCSDTAIGFVQAGISGAQAGYEESKAVDGDPNTPWEPEVLACHAMMLQYARAGDETKADELYKSAVRGGLCPDWFLRKFSMSVVELKEELAAFALRIFLEKRRVTHDVLIRIAPQVGVESLREWTPAKSEEKKMQQYLSNLLRKEPKFSEV
eukprot:s3766_g3.t1